MPAASVIRRVAEQVEELNPPDDLEEQLKPKEEYPEVPAKATKKGKK